jgi:ComF family protein
MGAMWKGILVTIAERVHEFGRILLDLLYPPRCVGCGQVGTFYCDACFDATPLLTLPVCPLCGRPQKEAEPCVRCVHESLRIDGIRSAAPFEGTLREAIHRLKYNHTRDLALPLGEMLVACYQRSCLPVDVIVPVPLHARRQRERGYNQAVLLAEYLGHMVGLPMVCGALYRQRHTVSQTQLDAQARRRNVEGAFVCTGSSVQDKDVLLIDDVCTTGATLEACSVALKSGGARSVWALTLARA